MDDIEEIYDQFAADAEINPQPEPVPEPPAAPAPVIAAVRPAHWPLFPVEIWFLLLAALVVFLVGIRWGLPSRDADPRLFGDQPAWDGARIAALTGQRPTGSIGADVDANPHLAGEAPVLLNGTDADRAEIVRRYRLFTYQPDEMITLMSLAQMHPGQLQLDPRLYQYGGLWVYPVGAMLKIGSALGLLTVVPDTTRYLDHPEQFAGFYLTMRLYVMLWGLVGVWAVYRIVQTSGGGRFASITAALLFACMPVVVNFSHEAKPHLPGAVLALLAAMAAGAYANSGQRRWWIIAAALCGAAMGMVLTGALALLVIPPAMFAAQRMPARRLVLLLGAAWGIGAAVYFLTNPYVLIHLLDGGTALRSNLSNTQAMYGFNAPLRSVTTAALLLGEGAGALTAIIGLAAAIALCWRGEDQRLLTIRILLLLSAMVLIQFILLAGGKPGEYGRFAIVADIVLGMACSIWIGRSSLRRFERVEMLLLILLLTALGGGEYLGNFVADSGATPRRIELAELLDSTRTAGATTLGVYDDPAPYSLPPVDLFRWHIFKLPRNFDISSGQTPVDVIVRPADRQTRMGTIVGGYEQIAERRFADLFPSRMSWANKPMNVWVRRSLVSDPRAFSE
jgi:hypothetical protein